MQRIFYFSGYRMKVFEWDEKRLLGSFDFEPDDDGFASFEDFLRDSIPVTTKLLVDMIEEEFLRETIPHVNFRDRKLLIKRLVEKHYRDEDNIHVQLIGRNTKGRKDDQILISALTNTGLLEPWLSRLDAHDVKLAGVWSLPLLTTKLFKSKFQGDDNTLVVTRQIKSALRNTYFRKGKLLLSRQAKFDKDIWEHDTTSALVSNLERGTGEIYNFLINQRIMENGEKLHVYCVVPQSQIDEANDLSNSNASIEYHYVELEQVFDDYRLKGIKQKNADVLLSYICAKESVFSDHYANEDRTATFYNYLVDRIIRQTWEVGTLLFITAAVLLALASIDLGEETKKATLQAEALRADYNQFYSSNQNELNSAADILASIKSLDDFGREIVLSPEIFFRSLGRIFSEPEYRLIQVIGVEWRKYPKAVAQGILRARQAEIAPSVNFYGQSFQTGTEDETLSADAAKLWPLLTLTGNVDTANLSYQATVTKMRLLSTAISNMQSVQKVLILKMPVDIRSPSSFSDQVGVRPDAERNNASRSDIANQFEFLIVLKVSKSA